MIQKNILLGMIVVAVFSFNLKADLVESKFYPRKYAAIPGDELRAQLAQTKNLKWAFCEELTNVVVRTLTRGLRKNNNNVVETKVVSWQADRKSFIFKYKAIVKDGIIVREECALKFSRMPALQTLNGKMLSSPTISKKQLSRFLYYLKKGNIEISRVNIGVEKDTDKAESLLDYLDIEDKSNVYTCSSIETAPQIRIILK
jgi:hypothetical protein